MTFGIGGWEPIKMRSGNRDELLAAKAQGENNPSVFGLGQKEGEMQVIDQGPSDVSKASAFGNKYGNSNVMTGELLGGLENPSNNFSQGGGSNLGNPFSTSGNLELYKDMGQTPQTSPDSIVEAPADKSLEAGGSGLDTNNLEQRLQAFAHYGRGANMNDTNQIYPTQYKV